MKLRVVIPMIIFMNIALTGCAGLLNKDMDHASGRENQEVQSAHEAPENAPDVVAESAEEPGFFTGKKMVNAILYVGITSAFGGFDLFDVAEELGLDDPFKPIKDKVKAVIAPYFGSDDDEEKTDAAVVADAGSQNTQENGAEGAAAAIPAAEQSPVPDEVAEAEVVVTSDAVPGQEAGESGESGESASVIPVSEAAPPAVEVIDAEAAPEVLAAGNGISLSDIPPEVQPESLPEALPES